MLNKRTIKSAIMNEANRLSKQVDLLHSLQSSLESKSFSLPLPLTESGVEDLLSIPEFKQKGVYIVSFESKSDGPRFVKQLEKYREGRKKTKENSFLKEAIVKPNGNEDSDTLYVGKIRSMSFRRRLRQHLIGDQNHRTTAIRLMKWLNKTGPKVQSKKLSITIMPIKDETSIRIVEKAMWNKLKPIIGDL